MMYDFDTVVNRFGTSSLKWDIKENELPMWVADMDFLVAPPITAAIKKRIEHGIFGYSVLPDEWYDAIISWWKRRHGLEIQKNWLQFTTGIVPAISCIVKRVTNIGDNVAVMSPVYNIFYNSIENAGRHTLECRIPYDGNKYSIDFVALEKVLAHPLTTLLILCNPHNPIGKIWSKDELAKIGALCHKHGVVVISDEIHCDLTEPGKKYTPFASINDECKNNSITCVSASKAFNIAGLQSAAVVVPNPILRNNVVRGLNSDEVAEPNCFAVAATVAAFNEGEQWLNELNAYIAENRRTVKDYLARIPEVHLVQSDCTYLLWIDCGKITKSSIDLCNHIRTETGLFLSNGAGYRGDGNVFVRMNIACPRSRLLDGLSRFEKGIKSYKE
ncbi:MAG: pyridoxal phosphate-dependent aminotransferase [Clostridiales bacterium]|nr:pyridoxal phosphate-dependent aminotransferase [Clostridiales bacterium]